MNRLDRRTKQWISGAMIILLSILVWGVYFYFPLKNNKNGLVSDITIFKEKIDQLKQRFTKLEGLEKKLMSRGDELARFSTIMVFGESLEDVNAVTQMLFQEFFEKNDITLTSYKVLSASRWKGYQLGRLEFNIATSMTGLDAILNFVENLDKVVKIENLAVNYTGNREKPLSVNLRMVTLFLDMGIKEGV